MSERDCPDERMVEWIEAKKQHGYYVLTREELDERIDEAQRDAYAEGRKDEQQELASVLPGSYYMDPPDGGGVEVLEQLQRMAKDAEIGRRTREHAEAAVACEIRCEG